jgi:hypothetical protein
LSWDVDDGFTLDAKLTHPKEKAKTHSLGIGGVISGTLIKLKFEDDWSAIFPNVFLDSMDVLNINLNKALTAKTDYGVFYSPRSYIKRLRTGTCIFSIDKATNLPDTLTVKKSIGDISISESISPAGIQFKNDKLEIIGYIKDKNILEVNWIFLTDEYTLSHEWQVARSLRTALSICLGQCIELKTCEILDHQRTIERIYLPSKATRLGHFSLLNQNHLIKNSLACYC